MESRLSKRFLAWMETVRIRTLSLIAASVVLGFAASFWLWQGVRYSNSSKPVSFGNCLYFSIVTFTSLGYGDIVPTGYAKPLAATEVIMGLAFLGVGIAKLSSARQNYHLAQLYARDAQERVDQFVISLRELWRTYKETLERLKRKETVTPSVRSVHMKLGVLLMRVHTYLSFEIRNGDLLNEMPTGPVARLLKTSTKLAPLVVQVANVRKSQHSEQQRRHGRRVVLQMADLGRMVSANSKDAVLSSEAGKLIRACDAAERELQAASEAISVEIAQKRSASRPAKE